MIIYPSFPYRIKLISSLQPIIHDFAEPPRSKPSTLYALYDIECAEYVDDENTHTDLLLLFAIVILFYWHYTHILQVYYYHTSHICGDVKWMRGRPMWVLKWCAIVDCAVFTRTPGAFKGHHQLGSQLQVRMCFCFLLLDTAIPSVRFGSVCFVGCFVIHSQYAIRKHWFIANILTWASKTNIAMVITITMYTTWAIKFVVSIVLYCCYGRNDTVSCFVAIHCVNFSACKNSIPHSHW